MEQIIRETIHFESKNSIPPLKLSPLFLIVPIMLIGFAVITVGTRTLAQYTVPLADPFPAYADLFPGQIESAVESHGFTCQSDFNYYDNPTDIYCTSTPAAGVFSSISVLISEGIIRQTTFLIRDYSLGIGDLELFLGRSARHISYHLVYFFFLESYAIAGTIGNPERFSLFLPVQSIAFTSQ